MGATNARIAAGRAALILTVLVTLVSACGDDAAPEPQLPAYSATGRPADAAGIQRGEKAATDRDARDRTAIERVYRDYQSAFLRLAAAGSVDSRPLRPYATAEMAQHDVEWIAILGDHGQRAVGRLGIVVRSIELAGDRAVMRACIDQRAFVLVRKGQRASDVAPGLPPGMARVGLVRESGGWLVDESRADGPC